MKIKLTLISACLTLLLAAPGAGAASLCPNLVREVRQGGSASSLYVIDASSGRTLCKKAPSTRRTLASNTKLFTTSTALARFGPDARIPTTLWKAGKVDGHGVLRGDIYLRGGGDPTLGSPDFYSARIGFGTNIFGLKRQLRAKGIKKVRGHLFTDDTIFDRVRGVADSGYATSYYIGPLSGLSLNYGFSDPSGNRFARNPALVAGRTLADSLRKKGVRITKGVAVHKVPWKRDPKRIGIVDSPAISRIVGETNTNSNNFFAEMLVKLLGARFGGEGSTAAGTAVVSRFINSIGSGVDPINGSGLTHSNRASAKQVATLLRVARNKSWGNDLRKSLAIAGETGTLYDRMNGTAADGRCRAKTGTLTGASALSGYCLTRSGRTIVFSILMNGVGDSTTARYHQDRIAIRLARLR